MKKILSLLFLMISLGLSAQTIDPNYETQKKSIIKMEFFSPLVDHTTFGYERYIKDWVSWEAKVGIIGLGVSNGDDTDPKGILFRGGPKFKLNPDFVTRDLRGSHLLGGKYIKPEIVFSIYSEDEFEFNPGGTEFRTRKDFTSFAFIINYGRQYILADIMSIGWHFGIGYGFDNGGDEGRYNYSHTNGSDDFPVAISAGFTLGVLLK